MRVNSINKTASFGALSIENGLPEEIKNAINNNPDIIAASKEMDIYARRKSIESGISYTTYHAGFPEDHYHYRKGIELEVEELNTGFFRGLLNDLFCDKKIILDIDDGTKEAVEHIATLTKSTLKRISLMRLL